MKSMPINLTASLIEKTVFSCTVLILGSLMQGIVAQSAAAQQLPPLPIEFNPDNLINPGRPGGRRRGGGSRGSCQAGLPLSAISYADSRTVQELGVSSVEETVGMLTTQAQPTLWFYLPAAVDDVSTEFIVKGAQEQIVYQGRLSGQTDSEGVISVLLPVNLAVGSAYRWFLTVDCDDTERVSVDGWVARRTTGPDATRTLAQASARNRVALYANYGFLQDAVSELGVLRAGEEGAIEQEWNQLLISLELPELVNARVFSCCEVVNAPEEVSQPEVEEITLAFTSSGSSSEIRS
ncbi:MAG: DUF928 domain-containing protein, partial [Cyanobacteria bacterium J06576_12]